MKSDNKINNAKNKIWKYWKGIYLWILSKFMTVEQKYQSLSIWKKTIIDNLESVLKMNTQYGYIVFLNRKDDKLEFKIGDRRFFLYTEINPYAEIVKYITGEFALNLNNINIDILSEVKSMSATTDLDCSSKINTVENIKAQGFANVYLSELNNYIELSFQNS